MSFAADIKNELYTAEIKAKCCTLAELCGLLCFGGAFLPGGRVQIFAESPEMAERAISLIHHGFGFLPSLSESTGRTGKSYTVSVDAPENALSMLSALFLLEKNTVSFRVPEELLKSPCCHRAFLRGAFLGGGSVTNPEKEYHLELITPRLPLAEDVAQLFGAFGLTARLVKRKANQVVYFKSSEEIGDVLNIIGATGAYMALINVKILKETRNKVNRQVNCENANMDKSLDAARLQIAAIRKLEKSGRLASLSPALQEAARVRLAYPEAPLSELGDRLHITKSGINHRLRKLVQIAEEK